MGAFLRPWFIKASTSKASGWTDVYTFSEPSPDVRSVLLFVFQSRLLTFVLLLPTCLFSPAAR